jgi:hypothetical protein
MRQFSVVAVAVLACVAYAMQARTGTEPPLAASPTFAQTKDTESSVP